MRKVMFIVLCAFVLAGGIMLNVLKGETSPDKQTVTNGFPGGATTFVSEGASESEKRSFDGGQEALTSPDPVVLTNKMDDELDIQGLRDQMIKERDIHQQIKLRGLELERVKLQLEQEKAFTEMHQLRKANQGVIRDVNGEGTGAMPDVKTIFIGVGEHAAQAILNINGTNFTVKPGDSPQENVVVKAITAKSVVVVINGTKELTLTPNLME